MTTGLSNNKLSGIQGSDFACYFYNLTPVMDKNQSMLCHINQSMFHHHLELFNLRVVRQSWATVSIVGSRIWKCRSEVGCTAISLLEKNWEVAYGSSMLLFCFVFCNCHLKQWESKEAPCGRTTTIAGGLATQVILFIISFGQAVHYCLFVKFWTESYFHSKEIN